MLGVKDEVKIVVRKLPTKEELEDYLGQMFGQKAKHGPFITFNIETGCFERLY